MNRPPMLDPETLGAFVDGELTPAARAAVAAAIAADPAAAARVEDLRRQREELGAAFEPILREAPPDRLLVRRRLHWGRLGGLTAALALAFGLGVAGADLVRGTAPGGAPPVEAVAVDLPARAAAAHHIYTPEIRHPVEVAGEERDHLAAWLTKRLGAQVRPPLLTTAGFELVGGRLLPDGRSPAAQFMYEDQAGRRVTLYLRVDDHGSRETAFRWIRDGETEVCYWLDGPLAYALVGNLGRKEMGRLAKTIYQQLNRG